AVAPEVRHDLLHVLGLLHRVRAGGAEHRAADREDARHIGRRERARVALAQQASPAVQAADRRPSVAVGAADDGADRRVESGAVTTTGENAYLHLRLA